MTRRVRKVVVEGVVSAYDFGQHIVDGRTPLQIRRDSDTRHARGSMNGGFGELMMKMEWFLDNVPTGLPLTITVKVGQPKPKRKRS